MHHHTNPGLPLAAVALDEQHYLTPGAGNQAVAHELLQGQNVFRLQKLRQKPQPDLRLRCVGIVGNGQAVQAKTLFLHKPAVQKQGSVGEEDTILILFQFSPVIALHANGFQQIFGFRHQSSGQVLFDIVEHIPQEPVFVGDDALRGEKVLSLAEQGVLFQKALAVSVLDDLPLVIQPFRRTTHAHSLSFSDSVPRYSDSRRRCPSLQSTSAVSFAKSKSFPSRLSRRWLTVGRAFIASAKRGWIGSPGFSGRYRSCQMRRCRR